MRKLRAKSFKSIPGKYYRTPKELWGFRTDRGDGSPATITRTFLETNRETLGITSALDRLDVRRVIHGQGADHVILQQLWRRRRIHRAYVTVHIGRDRRVYLVKSRAVPEDVLRQAEEPRIASGTAVRAAPLDFSVPSFRAGCEEVSAYDHVNEATAYLEQLGYRGPRRLFTRPIEIDARGTRDDNSWYSPGERTLTFGTGDVDDAEDGETVLHEFGHALQDAICPDFGQSAEAAAMGEGFGDYFAGSFFAARKPRDYRDAVMTWDGARGDGSPPCVRRRLGSHL